MKEKIDQEILSRYLTDNCSYEDQKYIEHTFADEQYEKELRILLESDWKNLELPEGLPEKDLSHLLHKLYYNMEKSKQSRKETKVVQFWKFYSRLAASVLVPLALIYGIYDHTQEANTYAQDSFAEIIAPLGSRIHFTLPDGSNGWLNSGSTLKYPVQFGDTRDVELVGEAYFDVVKNKNKPFNVSTSKLDISVLGTKFNVSAYQGDKITDVVLESGKVVLNPEGISKTIEMTPNERVVYNDQTRRALKSEVNVSKYSSWKEGKLIFRNDPLHEVIKRLDRWYNVEIILDENTHPDFRLRATFENESIEEVLRLIQITHPIEYKLEARVKDNSGNYKKRKITLSFKDSI